MASIAFLILHNIESPLSGVIGYCLFYRVFLHDALSCDCMLLDMFAFTQPLQLFIGQFVLL